MERHERKQAITHQGHALNKLKTSYQSLPLKVLTTSPYGQAEDWTFNTWNFEEHVRPKPHLTSGQQKELEDSHRSSLHGIGRKVGLP